MIRTTPGDAQGVDIVFLDERGADLSQGAQRKLERTFSRQEFRRAFPGEIADLTFPARTLDTYVQAVIEEALELLATGVWSGVGVLGPEAFDAVPFLDLLTEYGSPWGRREMSV